VQISPSAGFSILVVFGDETDKGVARLVWSWARRPRVVLCAIDASNGVRALVKGVLSSGSAAVVARRRQVGMQVRHVVWTYLDGGNGVGKIPP
jgi:hypothetical protein